MQYGWWCHRPPTRASISLNGPMSSPAAHTQWYIARNGQQYGPLSEAELGRFVELGHLQPTDLLWREGFPDWRPAMVVFPPRTPALPRMPLGMHLPPGSAQLPDRFADDPVSLGPAAAAAADDDWPSRVGRVVAFLLLIAVVAGAGGAGYVYRAQLASLAASLTAPSGAMSIADRKSLETPPLVGFRAGTTEAVDSALQATALWRVIKREFPDW